MTDLQKQGDRAVLTAEREGHRVTIVIERVDGKLFGKRDAIKALREVIRHDFPKDVPNPPFHQGDDW